MSKSVEVLEAELLQLVERHDERIYRMHKLHDKALEYARRTEHEHKGRIDALEMVLKRNGFVRCDIGACNCGSWHWRYGLPERMSEIRDALADAGHPPCNENGNLILSALNELIAERDNLKGGK